MKGYSVFNTEQIEGLPAQYYVRPEPPLESFPRIARAESYFAAVNADIRHGGSEAYYALGSDHIQMPPFESHRPGPFLKPTMVRRLRSSLTTLVATSGFYGISFL